MPKKRVMPEPKEQVIFETTKGRVKYGEMILTADTIRAFFGLAMLGKMVRFGVDERTNRTVVIERVPDSIEAYFGEMKRLLEKYKTNPKEGFNKINQMTNFAEKVMTKEKEKKSPIVIAKEVPKC
jgi:hypothetical protein